MIETSVVTKIQNQFRYHQAKKKLVTLKNNSIDSSTTHTRIDQIKAPVPKVALSPLLKKETILMQADYFNKYDNKVENLFDFLDNHFLLLPYVQEMIDRHDLKYLNYATDALEEDCFYLPCVQAIISRKTVNGRIEKFFPNDDDIEKDVRDSLTLSTEPETDELINTRDNNLKNNKYFEKKRLTI